jgi:hypothetical protein
MQVGTSSIGPVDSGSPSDIRYRRRCYFNGRLSQKLCNRDIGEPSFRERRGTVSEISWLIFLMLLNIPHVIVTIGVEARWVVGSPVVVVVEGVFIVIATVDECPYFVMHVSRVIVEPLTPTVVKAYAKLA